MGAHAHMYIQRLEAEVRDHVPVLSHCIYGDRVSQTQSSHITASLPSQSTLEILSSPSKARFIGNHPTWLLCNFLGT